MNFTENRIPLRCAFIALIASITPCLALGATSESVPMVPSAWVAKGDISFIAPHGTMGSALSLQHSSATLRDIDFANGVIEFDVKFDGGIAGITFRQHGTTGDVLYFRPSADCRTSIDCVQYMPVSHGIFEWDLYGKYQSSAPIKVSLWNHIKIVLAGKNMTVFVNNLPSPVMTVDRLAGDYSSGTIGLHGPASYSNLVLTPDNIVVGASRSGESPFKQDNHFLREWQVLTPFAVPSHQDRMLAEATADDPSYTSAPPTSAHWQRLQADDDGLVNLSRAFGQAQTGSSIIGTWLKTEIESSHQQVKHVRVGWVREMWVFVNGKLVFASKNLYGIPSASKTPDGRLSLDNGSFDLPLRRGKNEIAILLDDNMGGGAQHFGWGLEMRLQDVNGISFSGVESP